MQCKRDSISSQCSYIYSDSESLFEIFEDAFTQNKENDEFDQIQEKQRRRHFSFRRRSSGTDSGDEPGRKWRRLSRDSFESGRFNFDERRQSTGSSCSYTYSSNSNNGSESIEEKVSMRKRKPEDTNMAIIQSKKLKQMSIEEIFEAQEPNAENMATILGIMMLIWFEGILLVLPGILKKVMIIALKKRKISCKRILEQMSSALSCIKENLQIRKIELLTCSIQDFVDILRETVYYTIYTKHSIQQEDSEWILNSLIEVLPDQCSSSLATEITTTQSTTARTVTILVDVNSLSTSKIPRMDLGEDTIDELFRPSNIVSNTGTIQQSIAKRDGDVVVTLKSPGECGYRVIKLDIYEFGKIQHVPKNQWWQQATYRSTFITSSLADPKEVLVRRLLNMAATDLKKIPKVEREEKEMKSYFFSKGDQRRH